MTENEELRLAWNYVEHTGTSVFLTGKAGTGKTTFLKALREKSAKTMIVVAPSGVAAINAGGVTIHSFFQLPLSPYVPGVTSRDRYSFSKDKLRIVRSLDLLVIDEISMVRSDTLDAVDNALRKYRRDSRPFGGVQLLMIGDLRQLSPIVTDNDARLLRDHYETPYFYGSHALSQLDYVTVQLTKVFRQNDVSFVELLNHVRECRMTETDFAVLRSRLNPSFRPPVNSGYIRLTSHNHQADSYNDRELAALPGRSYTYDAVVSGTFPESSYPTSRTLLLKPGAQVMFIKNDPSENHRYYNGKIGYVVYADIKGVRVRCEGDGQDIEVEPVEWENTVYSVNETTNEIESKVQGTFKQIPLRLAWAITIHKSQGLTFDRAIVDAGMSFAPGQVYVALSRCRTLEGLVLATPITPSTVMNDRSVSEYIAAQDRHAVESAARLDAMRRDYENQLLRSLFVFREISDLHYRLARNVGETFSKMFPEISSRLLNSLDTMQERIVSVSDKWLTRLAAIGSEQIASPEFQERLKGSCRYFADTLRDIFYSWITRVATVKSDNKQASRRVQDIFTDLLTALRSKAALLDMVAETGFSPSEFLVQKQRAMLEASSPAKTLPTRKRASKAPREPKPDTRLESLRLFRQGMSIKAIAVSRSLSASTIYRHFIYLIGNGTIDVSEILPAKTVALINRAIDRVGKTTDITEIKNLLPPSVNYDEIRIVIASRIADSNP